MQRRPTKTSGGEHCWWAAAAVAAIGLALYGWDPPMAQADRESPPQTATMAAASAGSLAQASESSATQPTAVSATVPLLVTAASAAVRRVRALPLAPPEGMAAPLLPLGHSTVEVVGKRAVEVNPGRTQASAPPARPK